jgi:hypothetical protein
MIDAVEIAILVGLGAVAQCCLDRHAVVRGEPWIEGCAERIADIDGRRDARIGRNTHTDTQQAGLVKEPTIGPVHPPTKLRRRNRAYS